MSQMYQNGLKVDQSQCFEAFLCGGNISKQSITLYLGIQFVGFDRDFVFF